MNLRTLDQGSPGRATGDQLSIILKGFRDHLRVLGYAPPTIGDYARAAGHFGRWLKSRRGGAAEGTIETIETFLRKHLRHCHCRKTFPGRGRDGTGPCRRCVLDAEHSLDNRNHGAGTACSRNDPAVRHGGRPVPLPRRIPDRCDNRRCITTTHRCSGDDNCSTGDNHRHPAGDRENRRW